MILYKAKQTAFPEVLEIIPAAASLISVLLQMKTSGKERSAAISLIYFSVDSSYLFQNLAPLKYPS